VKNAPSLAGPRPSPPGAVRAQASHFDVKTPLAGETPDPNAACGWKLFGNAAERSNPTLLETGFDNFVRSDFYMDLWQDCRKSTNQEIGFGNVDKPDFCCPE